MRIRTRIRPTIRPAALPGLEKKSPSLAGAAGVGGVGVGELVDAAEMVTVWKPPATVVTTTEPGVGVVFGVLVVLGEVLLLLVDVSTDVYSFARG